MWSSGVVDGPFAGSAPSCSSFDSARKLTISVSLFLLLHGSGSRDVSSRPVCSTSSYTAQDFWLITVRITISLCQINATISLCGEVHDDIVGHDHTIRALHTGMFKSSNRGLRVVKEHLFVVDQLIVTLATLCSYVSRMCTVKGS